MMEVKVWVDDIPRVVCGATYETTCQDVVVALAQALGRTGRFSMIEEWRSSQRLVSPDQCPVRLLQQWGEFAPEVHYVLRQDSTEDGRPAARDRLSRKRGEQQTRPVSVKRTLTFSGACSRQPLTSLSAPSSAPTSKLRKTQGGPVVPNGHVQHLPSGHAQGRRTHHHSPPPHHPLSASAHPAAQQPKQQRRPQRGSQVQHHHHSLGASQNSSFSSSPPHAPPVPPPRHHHSCTSASSSFSSLVAGREGVPPPPPPHTTAEESQSPASPRQPDLTVSSVSAVPVSSHQPVPAARSSHTQSQAPASSSSSSANSRGLSQHFPPTQSKHENETQHSKAQASQFKPDMSHSKAQVSQFKHQVVPSKLEMSQSSPPAHSKPQVSPRGGGAGSSRMQPGGRTTMESAQQGPIEESNLQFSDIPSSQKLKQQPAQGKPVSVHEQSVKCEVPGDGDRGSPDISQAPPPLPTSPPPSAVEPGSSALLSFYSSQNVLPNQGAQNLPTRVESSQKIPATQDPQKLHTQGPRNFSFSRGPQNFPTQVESSQKVLPAQGARNIPTHAQGAQKVPTHVPGPRQFLPNQGTQKTFAPVPKKEVSSHTQKAFTPGLEGKISSHTQSPDNVPTKGPFSSSHSPAEGAQKTAVQAPQKVPDIVEASSVSVAVIPDDDDHQPQPHLSGASDSSSQTSLEIEEYDLEHHFPANHRDLSQPQRPSVSLEYHLDEGLGSGSGSRSGSGTEGQEEERARLLEVVESLQVQLREQEEQVTLINTEISSLEEKEKDYEDKLQAVASELLEYEQRSQDLERQLVELEGEEWDSLLAGEKQRQVDLTLKIKAVRTSIQQHEEKLAQVRTQETQLTNELKDEEEKLRREQELLKAEEAKAREEEERLKEEISRLRASLTEEQRKTTEVDSLLTTVDSELKSVEEDLKHKQKVVTETEAELKDENLKDFGLNPAAAEGSKSVESGETVLKILEGRMSPRLPPTPTGKTGGDSPRSPLLLTPLTSTDTGGVWV